MGEELKNQYKPIILKEGNYSLSDLNEFKTKFNIWKISDIFKSQLQELYEIQNPSTIHSSSFKKDLEDFIGVKNKPNMGNWIYFPWSGILIHSLNESDYFDLRTNRNKLLITNEEQRKLFDACVGFVGLSIGSHFAISLAYSGISNSMKLAEFDKISTSNLNRLRAGIKDIGSAKIEFASSEIYNINPYADLDLYPDGISGESLVDFFNKGKKLNLIFEAIDDFEMKIKLRLEARKQAVPVIMLTNLGDSLLVDVERFDIDKDLPLFNGLIGKTPEEILNSEITEKNKIKHAIKITDPKHLSGRILETLYEINKTLVGRPQLFSTVSMAGGFSAYLAKKLILEDNLKSGRYYIEFDNIINALNSSEEIEKKNNYLIKLTNDFDL